MPAGLAGADRDADPAAVEVQHLGRACIRQALALAGQASVAVRCFPQGEEAGQLLAGHGVQGDREVAVGGRRLRWFGVIGMGRASGCGTAAVAGFCSGVPDARAGAAPDGLAAWSFAAVSCSGRSAPGCCCPAGPADGVCRVPVPGRAGGSCRAILRWRGACGGCRAAGACGDGVPGRCRARLARGGGAGAVLRGRAVLLRVIEQAAGDGAGVAVDVAGVLQVGGRWRRCRPRSRPRRRQRPRSAARQPACLRPRRER